MTESVEGAGVELAYESTGSGPSVLLVHGFGDAGAGWAPTARALAPGARVVAYDRRGYGGSGAPVPYEATTASEQGEDAAAVIRGLGLAPVVLAGEDVGALACLDLILRHRALVRGAVLVDPPLFAFVPEATEVLAADRVLIEEHLRADGPAAAVDAYLEAAGYDSARRARGRQGHAAFFADYAGLASLELGRRDLGALDLPIRVVSTARARPHEQAAARVLLEQAPLASAGTDVVDAVAGLLAPGRRR